MMSVVQTTATAAHAFAQRCRSLQAAGSFHSDAVNVVASPQILYGWVMRGRR